MLPIYHNMENLSAQMPQNVGALFARIEGSLKISLSDVLRNAAAGLLTCKWCRMCWLQTSHIVYTVAPSLCYRYLPRGLQRTQLAP